MIRRASILLALCAWAGLAQTQADPRDLWFSKVSSALPAKQAPPAVPHSYALVIGISRYKNLPEENQLKYGEADANSIYNLLISQEGGQFPAENIKRLIGPDATLANITQAVEQWLPAKSHADDRVLIYFAGHGFLYDGQGYLAPYDIDLDHIARTAYSMDRLGDYFGSRIKAKWRVLLTDACHSGAITPASDAKAINDRLSALDSSVFSLTASRDREVSYEDSKWGGGHGVFTYFVLQGLNGWADYSHDGVVTADELAEYVHTNVREATEARQNPTADRASFDAQMVLAYHPVIDPSKQPRTDAGQLVIESDRDGVEVFVDGNSHGPVNKDRPLYLPGVPSGKHTIQGVHQGYEPDGPREVLVYPGQNTPVRLSIQTVRQTKPEAVKQFNRGFTAYLAGGPNNYAKAAQCFQSAFSIDPRYSQAAMYLGSTYRAEFDLNKADQYFRKAITIDPDFTEAHARYGSMLLDRGDYDGAIRQLNAVVSHDPGRFDAHYMLGEAFARKQDYDDAIAEARKAVSLSRSNGESHFNLAEALRYANRCPEAAPEYTQYLKLSNFDSGLSAKIWDILLATGKKRASQHDIWMELRNMANFGLCDCARKLNQPDSGIAYCKAALTYDQQDPFSHFELGLLFTTKYDTGYQTPLLIEARQHFARVISINSDIDEAKEARNYIAQIDKIASSERQAAGGQTNTQQ